MHIDCDVTPFTGSLAEAVEASAAAGDAIIANASIDAETNTVTVDSTDTKRDVGFDERVTARPITRSNYVLKDSADEAVPVTTT
jgi:hypothetical protein